MKPFFGYFGGKFRDTPKHYPVPKYDTIVEACAGAMGYGTRYWNHKVIGCDPDPVIYSVWSYLLKVEPSEILALPDVPYDGCVDDLNVCQEARWLIGFWLTKGNAYPARSPSSWMRKGIHHTSFWSPSIRQRLAAQVPKIRHWKVYNCTYSECPYEDKATWFVDPPYERQGRRYRFGSTQIDYTHLASWCQSRPGQVIVCESQGAQWLPFVPVGTVRSTWKATFTREVAWIRNDPSE